MQRPARYGNVAEEADSGDPCLGLEPQAAKGKIMELAADRFKEVLPESAA